MTLGSLANPLPFPLPTSLTVNIPPRFEAPGLNGVLFDLCEAVPAGWENLVTGDIKIYVDNVLHTPPLVISGNCLAAPFTIPVGTNEYRIEVNNHPFGRIKIVKNTVNGNGVFNYITTGTGLSNFSLDTGLVNTANTGFIKVKPGSYSVPEDLATLPAGNWAFTSLVCSTGGSQDGTTTKANITIIPGRDVTCTYTNTLTVPTEACSPGYWKQPQHFGSYPWQTDPWGLLVPSQQVVPVDYLALLATTYGSVFASAPPELFNLTFPEVISMGGGGIYALGRHSAAAYLNSVTLDGYGFSPAQVVQITNDSAICAECILGLAHRRELPVGTLRTAWH
jgi:hypothetical protein